MSFFTGDVGPYLRLADDRLNILTVFDDLKYDRSDADMLSPGMRKHAVDVLVKQGFKQVSGSVLRRVDDDIECHIPKAQTLGASPFDATRYTPTRPQDFFLLTPTQTACQWIEKDAPEEAIQKMIALVQTHPINVLRIADYLEKNESYQAVFEGLGMVKAAQRDAIAAEPLCRRRAL